MFHDFVSLQGGSKVVTMVIGKSLPAFVICAGKEAATGCRIPWFLGDGKKTESIAWS